MVVGAEGIIRVLDMATGNELTTSTNMTTPAPIVGSGSYRTPFCLNDQAIAAINDHTGGIVLWDWKTGARRREIAGAQTGSINCLAASPDGQHLASGGPDRWVRVWNATTGQLEAAFRAQWESVLCMQFSPDGREILSGGKDGIVRLQDAATGEETLALYGLGKPVVDAAFSPDGTLIAAIDEDADVKVWNRKLSSDAALPPERVSPQPNSKQP
jgi:WD40 repeat protein